MDRIRICKFMKVRKRKHKEKKRCASKMIKQHTLIKNIFMDKVFSLKNRFSPKEKKHIQWDQER